MGLLERVPDKDHELKIRIKHFHLFYTWQAIKARRKQILGLKMRGPLPDTHIPLSIFVGLFPSMAIFCLEP